MGIIKTIMRKINGKNQNDKWMNSLLGKRIIMMNNNLK
jgi:hypothetical protein